MLSIFNGSSVADAFKSLPQSSTHTVLAWSEALTHGPLAPAPRELWLERRAQHLASAYEDDAGRCLQALKAQEASLDLAGDHDEVVLWMGRDLFCLVVLLYLADRLRDLDLAATKLSLICPDGLAADPPFPCLGSLPADKLGSLFAGRTPLGRDQLCQASDAWRVYAGGERSAIVAYPTDTLFGQALAVHAERLSTPNRELGIVDRTILRLVAAGNDSFPKLFARFCEALPRYGWGDMQARNDLWALADADPRLIDTDGTKRDNAAQATLRLTDAGRAAVARANV